MKYKYNFFKNFVLFSTSENTEEFNLSIQNNKLYHFTAHEDV